MRIHACLVLALAAGCASSQPANSCATAADCTDPALPFCVEKACVACDTADACTPEAPRCSIETHTCGACADDSDCSFRTGITHCDVSDGTCVGCVSSAQCEPSLPVCDPMAQTCRKCAVDDECASGVCDDAGLCVGEPNVVYAAPMGGANSTCSKSDPCSLAKALTVVDATRSTLKLNAGTYTGVHAITGTKMFTVHGAGAFLIGAFEVKGDSTLRLRGLTIRNDGYLYAAPSAPGMPMPTLDLDQVTFDTVGSTAMVPIELYLVPAIADIRRSTFKLGGNAIGIYANGEPTRGSMVKVSRSSFQGGRPSIDIRNKANIVVSNSIMYGYAPIANASDFSNYAFDWERPAPTSNENRIEFSTIYDSKLACPNINGMTLFRTYNSVFVNTRPVSGMVPTYTLEGGCVHNYTIAFPQDATLPPVGPNNKIGDPMFKNPAQGDFHLLSGSPAMDAADPAATEMLDFEGTPRPQGAGRDMGALELK